MSGTYKPIAGLSPTDQGPVNTIVAIILCTTSILFSSVRYAIGRKRLLQFDSDDATFGIALCLAITTSVVSQSTVRVGLGQHQDTLSADHVERFFKLRWTSQFLAIAAMTASKLSIVLMFQRIVPVTFAPFTLKILGPVTALYAFICLFLIGFQCSPPSPWVLDPKTCSTHGHVYYATTTLNILTDLLLAGWILPAIWALQMNKHTKYLVMSLFATRVAVCLADVGRFVVIRRALHSADQTWSQLLWAVLDQLVVHLSLNHATLPRVHVFLSNLQTGLLVTRLTTNATKSNSKGSKPSRDPDESLQLSGADEHERSSRWKWRSKSRSGRSKSRVLNLLRSDRGASQKEGSISESPLRLQPEQGIELSTQIYADADSTASGTGKNQHKDDWHQPSMHNGGPSTAIPNEHLSRSNSANRSNAPNASKMNGSHITINVHRTVEMKTEHVLK